MSGQNVGIAQLPGFDASLRLLVERERYSIRDIGDMFGVSGERIRQICEARGLRHPDGHQVGLMCARVWDDAAHCFRPVAKQEVQRRVAAVRRARRSAAMLERRARIIQTVAELSASLNREPSWREIYVAAIRDADLPKEAYAIRVLGFWMPTMRRGKRPTVAQTLRDFRRATQTTGRTPADWSATLSAAKRRNRVAGSPQAERDDV